MRKWVFLSFLILNMMKIFGAQNSRNGMLLERPLLCEFVWVVSMCTYRSGCRNKSFENSRLKRWKISNVKVSEGLNSWGGYCPGDIWRTGGCRNQVPAEPLPCHECTWGSRAGCVTCITASCDCVQTTTKTVCIYIYMYDETWELLRDILIT